MSANRFVVIDLQKLLCIHQAEFRVTIEAVWEKDGGFEDLGNGRMLEKDDDDANNKTDDEDME